MKGVAAGARAGSGTWLASQGISMRFVPLCALLVIAGGAPAAMAQRAPLELLGATVAAGTSARVPLTAGRSYAGATVRTPVLVHHGATDGPTLCLIAGIHGDELNGIEIVRRVAADLDAAPLRGTVIAVPVVNLAGFRGSSRYLPDRRDLNRHFPGDPSGSAAARIADALFRGVIRRCDVLVDLHTGSHHRGNLPQIRADLTDAETRALARAFGAPVTLHKPAADGTLRAAASAAGVATLAYEAGEPMRLQTEAIDAGLHGIRRLMAHLGIAGPATAASAENDVYGDSHWVRANSGGLLVSTLRLGDEVHRGQELGVILSPLSETRVPLHSPFDGRVIGRALAPVMLPGYAAFHIAVEPIDDATAPPPGTAGDLSGDDHAE